ncbi:InlB B-repeat-containing protein, partial [Fibrobacter sp.]|uniref:InlB B-repeat-containing protein n=1 Tax=Fibrobacter sp. TaxID=35828 RepID=UPI003890D845
MIRNALKLNKLTLVLVCWFALVGEGWAAWNSTTSQYEIGSCADLKTFASYVNSGYRVNGKTNGSTYPYAAGVNVVLTQDINCSGTTGMTPIGTSTTNNKYYFTGTFDGQGYTISNLSISTDNKYVGLFGYVDGAEIKDVFINSSSIKGTGSDAESNKVDTTKYYYSGAIVGYLKSGTVTGCATENTTVDGGNHNYQAWASGGIVGRNEGGTIEMCSVTGGNVNGRTDVGGIAGINKGTIKNCLASAKVKSYAYLIGTGYGGIVGTNSGSVSRVAYTGTSVSSNNSGTNAVGGPIVGDGTGCSSQCFYSENVGLAADGNDALESDADSIKASLGAPWDVYGESLVVSYPTHYYTVKIDPNGHGNLDSVLVKQKDGLIPLLDSIIIDDYKRVGLCRDAVCNQQWNMKTDKVTNNRTLYARWAQTYLVSFVVGTKLSAGHFPNGATTTKRLVEGEAITGDGITEPIFDNAAFLGWSKTDGSSTDANLGTMGTAPVTIYAIGTNDYWTITYDKGNYGTGTKAVVRVAKSHSFTLEGALFTRTNYAQSGWTTSSTDGSYGVTRYDLNETVKAAKDLTLYPHWTNSNLVTITYKFDESNTADGTGKTIAATKKANGVNVKLSAETFSKEGHTQDGWSRIVGGDKSFDLGETYTQNSDATFYPHWKINKHAVKYQYSLDGTTYTVLGDVDSVAYATADVIVRDNYMRDGYDMSAWTTTDVTVNAGKFTMPDKDVVFTSTGTKKNYAITYYVDGTQYGETESVSYDAAVTPRAAPTKTGYTFSGWTWYSLASETPVVLEDAPSKMPFYNLKAEGEFSVNIYDATFDANGGKFSEGVTTATTQVAYDAAIAADGITTPTRDGYVFKGWARAADAAVPDEGYGKMDSEGVKFYAVWVQTFTVTFNMNGHGTAIVAQTVESGASATEPDPAPSAEGYTFAGWYVAADFSGDAYDFTTAVTANVTLNAKWTVQVTFDMNDHGSAIDAQTVTVGSLVTEPESPTAEGFRFDGWFTDDETFQSEFDFANTVVTAALVLHAKWTPVYTVVWNDGVEDIETDEIVPVDTLASDIAPSPTKTGYTLSGWNDGTTTYTVGEEGTFASLKITGNATFTAHWTVNNYTATFDANEGVFAEGAVTSKLVDFDAAITAEGISEPTREGYAFKGWSRTQGATVADADLGTMNSTEGVPVYAVWVQTFTVTFVKNGHGSDVEPQIVESGSTATKPDPVPAEDGYTFAGWFSDDAFASEYVFSTPVAANVNLYAKWTVQVTFDMNEHGTAIAAQTETVGTTATAPAAPTAEGFRFDGWFTDDETFQSEYDFANTVVTAALVLHAKWTPVYTVVWNDGVEDIETDENVADGTLASTIAPEAPTKTGYTFAGWNDGTTTYTTGESGTLASRAITAATTFTAQWTINKHKVTYKVDEVVVGEEEEYDYAVSVTLRNKYIKTGYTVTDWALPEGLTLTSGAFSMPDADVVITATSTVNQYTITLNANGGTLGTGASPITQEYGSAIQTRADPTKTGYTFAGWFENEDLSGDAVTIPATMPAKTYTLYAKWTPAEVNYTVKTCTMETDGAYDENKCTSETKTGLTEATADATPASYETGFALDEEKSTLTGTILADGSLVLNVYIKRIAYTITFANYDNATLQSSDFLYGATPVYSAAEPTKAADAQYSYAFAGWSSTIAPVTGTATYTAQFTQTPVSYTLAWDFAGGTAKSVYTAAGQVPYGTALDIPEIEKEGYAFQSWSPEAPEAMPAANLTLTATWAPNEYTITFNSNGGSEVSSIVADYESAISAPTAPTRDGYMFVGWFENEDLSGDAFTFSAMPLNGAKLYAKWNMDVKATAFTGTYDGEAHGITVTAPEGAAVTYSDAENGTYVAALTYTEVGVYTVYYKASQEGYADVKGSSTVTINKATDLAISKFDGATFTYDAQAHALSAAATTNALTGTTTIEYQFDGDAAWTETLASLTKVAAGTYTVNVRATNPNYSNTATGFATLTIDKAAITVNIAGSSSSVKFDGEEHSVSGYTATSESVLFDAAKVVFSGTASAKQTTVGKKDMGLTAAMFSYEGANITATFVVTDGYQEILVADEVIVTITGHSVTGTYDGTDKTATGYDISASSTAFDKNTVSYAGTASVTVKNAGTANMNLDKTKFSSTDANFSKVTFEIAEDGYVTVNKKTAEITWSSETFTYTGTAQAPTATVTNLVTGDACAVTVTGAGTDADNYTATATALDNANYALPTSGLTKDFTIGQATIVVETEGAKRAYDGTALTAGGSIKSGLVNGETASITLTGTQTNVGKSNNTFTMVWGTAKLNNYKISSTLGELEVTPAAVTVTADAASKTYGEADPTFTGKVEGLVNAADLGTIAYVRTDAATDVDAGTYTNKITATYTENANYTVTVVPATFTINKRAITLTSATDGKTYDGTALTANTVTVTEGTYANDESFQYNVTGSQTDVGESDNEFTYRATSSASSAKVGNYEVTLVKGKLTVTKRAVTFTGKTDTKTFTGSEIELTEVTADGLVDGHTHNVTYSAKGTAVGDYSGTITAAASVVIKDASNNDVTANYTVTTTAGKLTIVPAEEFSIALADDNYTYDGAAHHNTKTATSTAAFGTTMFQYQFAGDAAWVSDLSSLTKVAAGTYTINVKATNPNYSKTATGSATLTVNPKVAEITWSSESFTYTGAAQAPTATVTNLVTGDACAVTVTGAGTDADNYTATATALSNANYVLPTSGLTKDFTIGQATIVVETEGAKRTYNGEALTAGGSIKSGLVNGETASISLTGTQTNVGKSNNTFTMVWGTAKLNNYKISSTLGELEVTPKAVVVKATAAQKTYGDADPTLTSSVEGLVEGESESLIVRTVARATGENVGTYAITASGEAVQGNYEVSYEPATFTINPKAIAVAVNGNNASTIYDGADHPVTGFTATTEETLYDVTNVALATGKTASATTKNVGKVPMGLTAES